MRKELQIKHNQFFKGLMVDWIMYLIILVLLRVVLCDEYSTELPKRHQYIDKNKETAVRIYEHSQIPFPHGRILTEPNNHGTIPNSANSKDSSIRRLGGHGHKPITPQITLGRSIGLNGTHEFIPKQGDNQHYSQSTRVYGSGGINTKTDVFKSDRTVQNSADEILAADGDNQSKCTSACSNWEFVCSKNCECISNIYKCNNIADCPDGEDEEDCVNFTENIIEQTKQQCEQTGRIMCPRTLVCITKDWLCDGDDDCGDYSDETHCGAHRNCSDDQFECLNGLCIQHSWVCDGDNDCKDYSDEMNCTKLACTPQEFACNDGSCVTLSFKCDGDTDCTDGSDESNCETALPACSEGEFKCKSVFDNTGGPRDSCVLLRFRCDGDNDCGDWSDEEGCPKKPSTCPEIEFKCDDGTCIPGRWRCDGEQDCDGGEDEKDCNISSDIDYARACVHDEYACKDGKCILKSWMCDGVADCRKGEDEIDCETVCEPGQFSCPSHKNSSISKHCVHQKHICDGQADCTGGEDEMNCPTKKTCAPHSKCEHNCVTSSSGKDECTCRNGFILHWNGNNCTDIDECQFALDPVCSQKCYNTIGSFSCGCAEGYILRPDLRTCKALGGAVKLIMANRADIRQVTLNNHKYTSILKGLHNAIALDYHFKKRLIFYSDVSTDVIKSSYINGSGTKDVIKWGLESPGGVAVDWIHDLLFWTDSGTRRVEVAPFDGTLRAVIAANDLDKPRAIVVHPGEALVLWTDWGPIPKIERCYMDGSERQTLIKDGVFWPNGLAIDYPSNRIYWADAKHHVIESSDLEGKDRKKILGNHLPHPFALTIFEDSMYWTDWHTKAISTANKITGKGFKKLHDGLHFPMDIHSFHPARQPHFYNRCAMDRRGLKGGCSHLCLPNKSSRRCGCSIGLTLLEDQKTCSLLPDRILLVARKKDIRVRQLNPRNASTEIDMVVPLDGLKSTVGLDWCSKTDYIYWTDIGRSTISRAFLNGSNQETIIQSNVHLPAGLALDWVTNKLYWTDSGTNRIEVSSIDGKQRALLIWQHLDKPRDIVVNPIDGYMFWCDWGAKPLIERAGMDGSERNVIVSNNLNFPNGLAVDTFSNDRLYFVDGGTKTLEYVNFDGSGRTVLIDKGLMHPFGIDIYENKVFWTDWDTQSVEVADKHTGKNRKTILSNASDFMDIQVFHRMRKDISNPCSLRNGECSHICLLNPRGYSCSCPIGVKLSKNNRTCNNGPENYILFSHRVDVRQISLDIDYIIDVVLPLPRISNVVALDVDQATGDFYWSDTLEDVIMRSSADGLNSRPIISESLSSVDGLVIDSVGLKIYWTDAGRHTVEVADLDGKNRNVLIWSELESPRGIVLSYEHGYLFWTDWGSTPKIERSEMDGTRRTKILGANLSWPNCLSMDEFEKRIYWTDAQIKNIQSADFDGKNRKIVISELLHPYGISVVQNSIYWTDWGTLSLHVMQKNNINSNRTIKGNLEGLMDVKVVEKSREMHKNVCGTNNGGCSHLCLRNAISYSCQCPTGIQFIESSNTTCETLPKEYLIVALRSGIGRVSLDSPDFFDVVLPIQGIHGVVVVDFHYNQSKIFYADVNTDKISVTDMKNMSNSRTILSTDINTPNGIAIDWIANNIYWTDSGNKAMEVAKIDGTSRKLILSDGMNAPSAMILYPKYGFIFWSDWGKPARIERCLMDGSQRKAILNTNLGYPTGLSIDFETDKIYWADALQDRIEYSNFDGENRMQIMNHATHPFGLTIFGPYIYWTDWYNKSIFRYLKTGNSGHEEIRHGLRGALEIRSVSKTRQPEDSNPCGRENGGCSHLCFFKGSSYTCGCPDKPDGRNCKLEPKFKVAIVSPSVLDKSNRGIFNSNTHTTPLITARIVIIATIVVGVILIIVVTAIICLVCNSKRKRGRKSSRTSSGSILTFTNPNYNVGESSGSSYAPKATIWRRFKYDKSQDRVYEEKNIGHEMSLRTLITGTPSPTPSPSAQMTLSTIG